MESIFTLYDGPCGNSESYFVAYLPFIFFFHFSCIKPLKIYLALGPDNSRAGTARLQCTRSNRDTYTEVAGCREYSYRFACLRMYI